MKKRGAAKLTEARAKPIKVVATLVHNGVKIYPAHQATLKAVMLRDGEVNQFDLEAVLEYHRRDGYKISPNWARRTLLELCKAKLLSRTHHGVYVVTEEGKQFEKTI